MAVINFILADIGHSVKITTVVIVRILTKYLFLQFFVSMKHSYLFSTLEVKIKIFAAVLSFVLA